MSILLTQKIDIQWECVDNTSYTKSKVDQCGQIFVMCLTKEHLCPLNSLCNMILDSIEATYLL